MKSVLSFIMAGVIAFSILFVFPSFSQADTDKCYDEWEQCFKRAIAADAGKLKTTLMLTLCDIALGVCLIANAL